MIRRFLPLLALAAACFGADDKFEWSGAVAAGQHLEIRNVNGSIHAVESTGSQVQVVATKRGRKNDPSEVRIEVVPHAGGVTICAIYPSRDADKPNECRPGGGRNNVQNNDVNVAFEVRIPNGVALKARTVNGGIDAKGLAADVEAHSVNGRIQIASRGNVEAKTVNGAIQASMGTANWSGIRKFSTVNGSISIEVPPSLSTDVKASTVNGDIDSDLPILVRGKISRRKLEGTIGNGGRMLELSTVNGSIQLRRG